MAADGQICTTAMQRLSKNSTKLVACMVFGIAIGVIGFYSQFRGHPGLATSKAAAKTGASWLFDGVGQKLLNPASMLPGCSGSGKVIAKTCARATLAALIVKKLTIYMGGITVFLHAAQILMLKLGWKSVPCTYGIIATSIAGTLMGLACFLGSLLSCKEVCLTCVAVQNIAIIYFAICRLRIVKNMTCPPETMSSSSCVFPSGASGKGSATMNKVSGLLFSESKLPKPVGNDSRRRSAR